MGGKCKCRRWKSRIQSTKSQDRVYNKRVDGQDQRLLQTRSAAGNAPSVDGRSCKGQAAGKVRVVKMQDGGRLGEWDTD